VEICSARYGGTRFLAKGIRRMNSRILLLVVGLVVGGLVGWVTRPAATELNLGPLHAEVQSDHAAGANDTGPLTNGQIQHIAIYTVVGGVIGALAGMPATRSKVS
jgi:hypothetical protein